MLQFPTRLVTRERERERSFELRSQGKRRETKPRTRKSESGKSRWCFFWISKNRLESTRVVNAGQFPSQFEKSHGHGFLIHRSREWNEKVWPTVSITETRNNADNKRVPWPIVEREQSDSTWLGGEGRREWDWGETIFYRWTNPRN